MNCGNVQILESPDSVIVNQSASNIQIFQGLEVIEVCAQSLTPKFLPYSFTAAEDNQTVFGPLDSLPVAVITLAITGTLQNPDDEIDYTIDGLNIVLNQGVAIGNTVYGMIQVL